MSCKKIPSAVVYYFFCNSDVMYAMGIGTKWKTVIWAVKPISFYIFNPLYFWHFGFNLSSKMRWIFSTKFTQAEQKSRHKLFSNLTFQYMLTAWELLAKGGLLDDWFTNNMTLDFWCFTAEQRDERPLLLISIAKWKRDEAKT